MKNIYFLLSGLLFFSGSCRKPDMEVIQAPGTVAVSTTVNYLNNNFDFSLFAAAVARSGLGDSLAEKNVICTILAVTNKGFGAMNIRSSSDFNKWSTDSLKHFVRTHLLPGRIAYKDIPASLDTRYKNMNGVDVFVSIFNDSLAVNGVKVIASPSLNNTNDVSFGVSLINGIIYPLNAAIKASNDDIQSFLASRNDMTIFVTALKKFGLWESVKERSPITVLAVPDSVFLRYGMTAEWMNNIDTGLYKKAFIDCYVIGLNRIFQSDIFTMNNLANASEIPATYPPLVTLSTTNSDWVLCMLGYHLSDYNFGCFVFDRSKQVNMPNEYGSTYWYYQILGVNATNYPTDNNPASGYQIPYIGESNKSGNLQGTYVNYSFSNGVVHFLSGLLLTAEDAKR